MKSSKKAAAAIALTIIPILGCAWSAIENDSDGTPTWQTLCAVLGFFGAMVCRENKNLTEMHLGVSEIISRWLIGFGLALAALSLLDSFAHWFYIEKNLSLNVFGAWGILRACQGIYISGVKAGVDSQQK